MSDLINAGKVLAFKHYKAGHVFLIEMSVNMIVVLCYINEDDEEPIYSRAFLHGEKNKDDVLKQARSIFNQIKECLLRKKLQLIEELN